MKKLKTTTLLFTIIASLFIFSSCVKKPVSVVNTNVEQNQNVNENTNVDSAAATTTEEIDTSDWLTYRNEEYGFEFKYPGDMSIISGNKGPSFILNLIDSSGNNVLTLSNGGVGFENMDQDKFDKSFIPLSSNFYILNQSLDVQSVKIIGDSFIMIDE